MVKRAKIIVLAAVLAALPLGAAFAGGGGQKASGKADAFVKPAETVTIRIGTNWSPERDVNYRDANGNPGMSAELLAARTAAEKSVLEKYNVKFEWYQYPGSGRASEAILPSVMAGAPVVDVTRVTGWEGDSSAQGLLLGQNVLQPIDDYAALFLDDPESRWMLWGKVYNHYFFLTEQMRLGSDGNLAYNLSLLEKVPALRENGVLQHPAKLFNEGKWTWTAFEDMLTKIKAYYDSNTPGTVPFWSNWRLSAAQAIHSNGGSIYGDAGIGISSQETKDAVAYIERLISRGLLTDARVTPDAASAEIHGSNDLDAFNKGTSAFAQLQLFGGALADLRARGESVGVVPWPRPDTMAADDPKYQPLNETKDGWAFVRGIGAQKTELAVRAFKEYLAVEYATRAGSTRALDYLQTDRGLRSYAAEYGYDVLHPTYGDDILKAMKAFPTTPNDYGRATGWMITWEFSILGDSIWKIKNTPAYSVNAEQFLPRIRSFMSDLQLSVDNGQPRERTVNANTIR